MGEGIEDAKYLRVEAGVRYWEDATVNDVEDTDGTLIPFRTGDNWCPLIHLPSGRIEGWPADKVASVHYKVCDDGRYTLLDEDGNKIVTIDDYVPRIMSPTENGYGDYIIMTIGTDGAIADWRIDLTEFERDE